MKKCIIFGASRTGSVAKEMLEKEYEIIAFSDNSEKKWGQEFCEKRIINPIEIKKYKEISIIIASVYYAQIFIQLKEMGIEDIQVFYYRGNAIFKDGKDYILYKLSEVKVFSKCKFDEKNITKIRENYFYNYDLEEKENNKNKKQSIKERKKVLICAYIFPPLGGAGVQRSVKFVKYLRNFGYEPVVLTVGKNDGKIGYDYSLLDEIDDDIEIIRVDTDIFIPEALTLEEQQEVFNLYCGVVQNSQWITDYLEDVFIKDSRLIPDEKIIWVNNCLKKIDSFVDFKEIDIIYTSGNPFSSYILGFYLSKKHEIPWVQDYRDAWVGCDYYVEHYYSDQKVSIDIQQKLEKELVKESDGIVVAASFFINEYVKKYGVDSKKFIEITNGYDEDDFSNINVEEKKNDKFTLCYNGSIYGDRSPIIIIECINELIEEGEINQRDIAWIFNGAIDQFWENELAQKDKYNIIVNNGYMEHLKSIEISMNSDLLILLGLHDDGSKFGYTGKVFEYLRMQKYILGLSTPGGIYDEIFSKTNAGVNCDYNDKQGIKKIIKQRYILWKEIGCVKTETAWQEIHKYSRKQLTKQLANYFDKIISK